MAIRLSEKAIKELEKVKEEYPDSRSASIPALHLAQKEFGYISEEVCLLLAEYLDISPGEVLNVASFYTMFNKKPVGKYLIQVCSTISCALNGSQEIVEHIKKRLDIDVGETTRDGKFTLVKVECLGSCGTAPVIQINDDYHENLTIEKVDEILDKLK